MCFNCRDFNKFSHLIQNMGIYFDKYIHKCTCFPFAWGSIMAAHGGAWPHTGEAEQQQSLWPEMCFLGSSLHSALFIHVACLLFLCHLLNAGKSQNSELSPFLSSRQSHPETETVDSDVFYMALTSLGMCPIVISPLSSRFKHTTASSIVVLLKDDK